MSLPMTRVDPPTVHPHIAAILDNASDQLHLAMHLVAVHRVPTPVVLGLTWPQIHPQAREIRVPGLTVHLDPATVELLHWRACRQRLDRRREGPTWHHSLRVFTDQAGHPYTENNADEAVTIAAARAGLPPVTFAGLRDLDPPTDSIWE